MREQLSNQQSSLERLHPAHPGYAGKLRAKRQYSQLSERAREIDTVDVYGRDGLSERVIGKWFQEYGRLDEASSSDVGYPYSMLERIQGRW